MVSFWYRILTLLLITVTTSFSRHSRRYAETDKGNLAKLVHANNHLALRIYRQLAFESSGNIFFSPLSLSTVFGMLYYGTQGDTAKELRQVLGYEATDFEERLVHQTFQQYLAKFLPSDDPSAYILDTANAILLNKDLNPLSNYKRGIQDFYQSSVRDVDFMTQLPQVVDEVNNWVKEKTRGNINMLLDSLDPSTDLVMLNAVYFKGMWNSRFHTSHTNLNPFYNNGLMTEAKEVPMMNIIESFPYHSNSIVDAFELPYKGENISMVILLPKRRDGLKYLERRLTLHKLSTLLQFRRKYKVYLSMPKFRVEYSKEMSCEFKSFGVRSIFTSGANFSGMTLTSSVFVKNIYHKAVIEVNEDGTEAVAVTGIISARMGGSTPELTVDHPFMFAIVDKRNGMILFLGRITNLK